MGKRKQSKLRLSARWSIWVSTLVLVALIPVSIWVRPALMAKNDTTVIRNRWVSVRMASWHVTIQHSGGHATEKTGGADETGIEWIYWDGWDVEQIVDMKQWWSPVWIETGLSIKSIEFSLMYPTVIGVVCSVIVWRRRKRFGAGSCQGCGYSLDGLDSDVCPECGERYE